MIRSNYHTHSHYCDGEGELESYVLEAISRKMSAIGFSSHAPLPFMSDWHMQMDQLDNYLSEIDFLKKRYREIEIYSGLEVDYIPGQTGPNAFVDRNLDIIIGSVHFVDQFEKQGIYCIDGSQQEFERALRQLFNNNIKELVARYYDIVVEMINNDPPDIIGHLDVIKKLNANNRYFNEEESWYQAIISEVVEALSASKCIIEVNTRGYYKSITSDFYPSRQILKKCSDADIPVTISSDAHHPNEIDLHFSDVATILNEIGFKYLYQFNLDKWSPVRITENEFPRKV